MTALLTSFLDSGLWIASPNRGNKHPPIIDEKTDILIWKDIKVASDFYNSIKRPKVWMYTINRYTTESGKVEIDIEEGSPTTLFIEAERLGVLFSLKEADMPEAKQPWLAKNIRIG